MSSRVIANIWYGDLVGADRVEPPRRTYPAQALAAWRLLRLSRSYDAIITSEGRIGPPGMVVLCIGLALSRQRKLAVMEFLPGRKRGIRGKAVAFVYRMLLRKVCVLIQVMTEDERATYSHLYRIPPKLLRYLPYYHLDDRITPERSRARRGVFSSGRQSCDWDTLMDAAEGQRWDLTIVWGTADYSRIRERALSVGAQIYCDISSEAHDDLLSSAIVCVISLTNDPVSSGHTRLMSALSRGVPTILSDVAGVKGYSNLASELVQPGDAIALRAAVCAVLADPLRLNPALASARKFGEGWTFSQYSTAIRDALQASVA